MRTPLAGLSRCVSEGREQLCDSQEGVPGGGLCRRFSRQPRARVRGARRCDVGFPPRVRQGLRSAGHWVPGCHRGDYPKIGRRQSPAVSTGGRAARLSPQQPHPGESELALPGELLFTLLVAEGEGTVGLVPWRAHVLVNTRGGHNVRLSNVGNRKEQNPSQVCRNSPASARGCRFRSPTSSSGPEQTLWPMMNIVKKNLEQLVGNWLRLAAGPARRRQPWQSDHPCRLGHRTPVVQATWKSPHHPRQVAAATMVRPAVRACC